MGQGLQLPWSIDCGEKDVTWLLGVGYKRWYSFCLALIFRTLALGTQEGKPQSHGEPMCRCSDQLHRLLNIWVSEPLDDSRLWAATADAKWNRGSFLQWDLPKLQMHKQNMGCHDLFCLNSICTFSHVFTNFYINIICLNGIPLCSYSLTYKNPSILLLI